MQNVNQRLVLQMFVLIIVLLLLAWRTGIILAIVKHQALIVLQIIVDRTAIATHLVQQLWQVGPIQMVATVKVQQNVVQEYAQAIHAFLIVPRLVN
jgi:hypothetical protein